MPNSVVSKKQHTASATLSPNTSAARYFRLACSMTVCKRRSTPTQVTRSPRKANCPRCSRRSSSGAFWLRLRMCARSSRRRLPSRSEASCSGTLHT